MNSDLYFFISLLVVAYPASMTVKAMFKGRKKFTEKTGRDLVGFDDLKKSFKGDQDQELYNINNNMLQWFGITVALSFIMFVIAIVAGIAE